MQQPPKPEASPLTPNVKKLIFHVMATHAIPPGGGLEAGIRFLSSAESIRTGFLEALHWVEGAIAALRSAADPNPYRNMDADEIARRILDEINKRTHPTTILR